MDKFTITKIKVRRALDKADKEGTITEVELFKKYEEDDD